MPTLGIQLINVSLESFKMWLFCYHCFNKFYTMLTGPRKLRNYEQPKTGRVDNPFQHIT